MSSDPYGKHSKRCQDRTDTVNKGSSHTERGRHLSAAELVTDKPKTVECPLWPYSPFPHLWQKVLMNYRENKKWVLEGIETFMVVCPQSFYNKFFPLSPYKTFSLKISKNFTKLDDVTFRGRNSLTGKGVENYDQEKKTTSCKIQ